MVVDESVRVIQTAMDDFIKIGYVMVNEAMRMRKEMVDETEIGGGE